MEIKARLQKPFKKEERLNFIVKYNHTRGYDIRETETELQAWGDTEKELLQSIKKTKLGEASIKAKRYIDNGEALFEFEEGKHIEATDGNIAKFTAYALGYISGLLPEETPVVFNTKENENVFLTKEQVSLVLSGLGAVQQEVWTVKFNYFNEVINNATSISELEKLNIDYNIELPKEEANEEQDNQDNEQIEE